MKIICFDIDGVICRSNSNNYKKSLPIVKNINLINLLFDSGFVIKLYTARYMGRNFDNQKKSEKQIKKFTVNQLKKWKVKYHNIFFGKPSFDMLIDDKSIFFRSDWPKLLEKQIFKIK